MGPVKSSEMTCSSGRALGSAASQGVLEHLVLDLAVPELLPQLGHVLHVHLGELGDNRSLRPRELVMKLLDQFFLLALQHWFHLLTARPRTVRLDAWAKVAEREELRRGTTPLPQSRQGWPCGPFESDDDSTRTVSSSQPVTSCLGPCCLGPGWMHPASSAWRSELQSRGAIPRAPKDPTFLKTSRRSNGCLSTVRHSAEPHPRRAL